MAPSCPRGCVRRGHRLAGRPRASGTAPGEGGWSQGKRQIRRPPTSGPLFWSLVHIYLPMAHPVARYDRHPLLASSFVGLPSGPRPDQPTGATFEASRISGQVCLCSWGGGPGLGRLLKSSGVASWKTVPAHILSIQAWRTSCSRGELIHGPQVKCQLPPPGLVCVAPRCVSTCCAWVLGQLQGHGRLMPRDSPGGGTVSWGATQQEQKPQEHLNPA